MSDKAREAFEQFYSDHVLPVTSDSSYTKEALEWAFQAAYHAHDDKLREVVEDAEYLADEMRDWDSATFRAKRILATLNEILGESK